MSAIAIAWVVCVLILAVMLFVGGAKTAEVRRVNDELLDALAELINALDNQPLELSDYVDRKIEYARELVEAYDEHLITIDTLPR